MRLLFMPGEGRIIIIIIMTPATGSTPPLLSPLHSRHRESGKASPVPLAASPTRGYLLERRRSLQGQRASQRQHRVEVEIPRRAGAAGLVRAHHCRCSRRGGRRRSHGQSRHLVGSAAEEPLQLRTLCSASYFSPRPRPLAFPHNSLIVSRELSQESAEARDDHRAGMTRVTIVTGRPYWDYAVTPREIEQGLQLSYPVQIENRQWLFSPLQTQECRLLPL